MENTILLDYFTEQRRVMPNILVLFLATTDFNDSYISEQVVKLLKTNNYLQSTSILNESDEFFSVNEVLVRQWIDKDMSNNQYSKVKSSLDVLRELRTAKGIVQTLWKMVDYDKALKHY